MDKFKIGEIANVFLIPKLESDTSDNPKYADVPYWSMQKNTFNELSTLQVIKLNPNSVWESYLKNQPINSEIWDSIKTTPTKNIYIITKMTIHFLLFKIIKNIFL